MNPILYILILQIFIYLPFKLFAQNADPDLNFFEAQSIVNNTKPGALSDFYNFNYSYEGVKGTPYIYEDFRPGQVRLISEEYLSNFVPLRYNIYTRKLTYFDKNKNKEWLFDSELVNEFYIYDSTRVSSRHFIKKPTKIKSSQPFFETIYNNKYKIYVEWQVMFLKAATDGAYARGKSYDEFKHQKNYIIQLGDNDEVIKFKAGKIPLKKLFGPSKKMAKSYIKRRDLDLKIESNFIELIKYIENFQYEPSKLK